MKFLIAVIAIFLSITAVTAKLPDHIPTPVLHFNKDTMIINQDFGGRVVDYLVRYLQMRKNNLKFAIDGVCNSSCALFLNILPAENVCVTDNAEVGLHQAYDVVIDPKTSKIIKDAGPDLTGSFVMLENLPMPIMMWLLETGGLTRQIKFVPKPLLHAMYKPCPDTLINPPKGEKIE